MEDNKKWLDAANEKYESCAYACFHRRGMAGCRLGGYPVLDCPDCNSYEERKEETNDG